MNIEDYLQMVQMQGGQGGPAQAPQQPPQNVPHGTFNPLEKGASEAIRAVRETIGAKHDRRRPWVEGLAAIANAIPNSRHIEQMPDVHPYASHDRESAENMQIMDYLQKAQLAKQHQDEVMRHHNEQARHNRAIERPSKEMHNEQAIADLQQKVPGAVPLSTLPAEARGQAFKEMRERTNLPSKLYPIGKTLNEMHEIVSKNPDLSTSLAAAMFPQKYKGGFSDTWKLATMNKDKRIKLERLNKLANDLVRKQINGLGSQRATVFLEQIMQASNPHQGLTSEAVGSIVDNWKQEYDYSLADSKATRGGIGGGYYVPMIEPESLETHEAAAPEAPKEAVNTRRKELLRRKQQLQQQLSGGQQ